MTKPDDLNRRGFCKRGLTLAAVAVTSSYGIALAAAAEKADDVIYLPASEQLKLFQAKKLSPVEVLQAQIKRNEAVGTQINAVTYTHFDEALKAAQASEQRYIRGDPRPLEGITVAMKDEHGKAGWIITLGSKVFKDHKVTVNHPLMDKLLEAGAVPHMQTTAPEMYAAAVTWTDLWGVTRNPWNLHYTVGGSSGGSGAALAAGMTTLATGSDMGGSIRIPCAFCGLYGFKPPYGRNAMDEGGTFLLQAGSGPMARTLIDTALMQNVLAGPAPYSPSSLRPQLVLPLEYPSIKGWKIAYSLNQSWAEIDPDVVKNTQAALKVLEAQGAIIEEVDLGLGMTGAEIKTAILNALLSGPLGADMAAVHDKYSDQLTTYARSFTKHAKNIGLKQAREASDTIHRVYAKLQDRVFLKGYKALINPTLATSRIKADFDPIKDKVVINGQEVDPETGWLLTPLYNLCNWNPVLAAPTGLAANNVPTGMQIVAQTFDDTTAFQVAAAYASATTPFFAGTLVPDFRDKL